jgi:hypothetical protein
VLGAPDSTSSSGQRIGIDLMAGVGVRHALVDIEPLINAPYRGG